MSEAEQASLTYSTDDGVYDVGKLAEDARVAFGYLVEVQKELQVLNLRSNVLQAAQQTFNSWAWKSSEAQPTHPLLPQPEQLYYTDEGGSSGCRLHE